MASTPLLQTRVHRFHFKNVLFRMHFASGSEKIKNIFSLLFLFLLPIYYFKSSEQKIAHFLALFCFNTCNFCFLFPVSLLSKKITKFFASYFPASLLLSDERFFKQRNQCPASQCYEEPLHCSIRGDWRGRVELDEDL
jgi:hypothetical protein